MISILLEATLLNIFPFWQEKFRPLSKLTCLQACNGLPRFGEQQAAAGQAAGPQPAPRDRSAVPTGWAGPGRRRMIHMARLRAAEGAMTRSNTLAVARAKRGARNRAIVKRLAAGASPERSVLSSA
jgi:hypothetical protein